MIIEKSYVSIVPIFSIGNTDYPIKNNPINYLFYIKNSASFKPF